MTRSTAILLTAIALIITISSATAEDKLDDGLPFPTKRSAATADSNLLTNPSFEGKYEPWVPPFPHPDCPFGICQTANMAADWNPWWITDRPTDVNPEYKPAESIHTNPDRVRPGGMRAQQYFSFESTHEAGIYQQVPVNKGTNYCFSIWGHSWSANDDGDAYSGPEHGWLDQKVGVDPTGGTDPQSANVIWGPPRLQYDEYDTFIIGAAAQNDFMTVFTYSRPIWSAKHNDVYWDDAELLAVEVDGNTVITPTIILEYETLLSDPKVIIEKFTITYPEEPCLTTWTATVDSSGDLHPTVFSNHSYSGAQVTVNIDSTGLLPGTHTATINIDTNLSMTGSPVVIPAKVTVIDEEKQTNPIYIPTIISN